MSDSLLDVIDFIKRLPNEASKAASLAINQVADRGGMKLIRSQILNDIAFPKDYLTDERLGLRQRASPNNLEAIISARPRATSLARFAQGQALGSRARIGVKVTVKRGQVEHLRQSWLVRLKNGNVGLAVRVKPGETFGNKNQQPTVWLVPDRVALLYGPSVDQVFDTVRYKVADPIGDMLLTEFNRQFIRLTS